MSLNTQNTQVKCFWSLYNSKPLNTQYIQITYSCIKHTFNQKQKSMINLQQPNAPLDTSNAPKL